VFNVSSLLLDDSLRPAMPFIDGDVNKPLRDFVQLSDDRMLKLLDRLLNSIPNSVTDCLCPSYSRPHVRRLNERNVLMSPVRQGVLVNVCRQGRSQEFAMGDRRSGGRKSPSGAQGQSPGRVLRANLPEAGDK